IKAIAIRVGDEIIQYAVDRTFQIDGKPHKLDGIGIATPKTRTTIIEENKNTFHVYTTIGHKVTVYNSYGYNLNITLKLPREQAVNGEPSLLGQLNGKYGDIIVPTKSFISIDQINDTQRAAAARRITNNVDVSKEELTRRAEELLAQRGITHAPTVKNLVYDYLHIPAEIRDQVIAENIPQVKEQITKREELVEKQKQAGYDYCSLNAIKGQVQEEQEEDGYLEKLEKRITQLERNMAMISITTPNAGKRRLENLEARILELEKQFAK
ncbi:unnamed protein product, partial [Adineta ricciae]